MNNPILSENIRIYTDGYHLVSDNLDHLASVGKYLKIPGEIKGRRPHLILPSSSIRNKAYEIGCIYASTRNIINLFQGNSFELGHICHGGAQRPHSRYKCGICKGYRTFNTLREGNSYNRPK